jgi:alkanesulfonate monooxygenase SsuD/methylene tetrahydromethanopterin reductase-like flavin-dependent oxidoreductase (luciferase family)
MLYPDQPIGVLIERIKWLEELGLDQVFLPDHSANLRNRRGPWFDSWAILAAAAVNTTRIRLGVLVANQILRPPSQLAKQAVTIDHLSNARFELGIGAGIFDWDHLSVGEQPWSAKERALRFTDYVAIVDGLLHHDGDSFDYTGNRLWVQDVMAVPGPLQSPRLRIIVGGQSPTVIRAAAEHADVWNTHGRAGCLRRRSADRHRGAIPQARRTGRGGRSGPRVNTTLVHPLRTVGPAGRALLLRRRIREFRCDRD